MLDFEKQSVLYFVNATKRPTSSPTGMSFGAEPESVTGNTAGTARRGLAWRGVAWQARRGETRQATTRTDMNTLMQLAQKAPERRKASPIARMEREFIRYVMDDIEAGRLTVEAAAVKMDMCGIPHTVMARVIARAQQQDVVSEWPELCETVLPRYEPTY